MKVPIFPVTPKAVSYTHLDVYKRQVWGTRCCCVSACSKRGRLPGASLMLIKKGVLYAKKIRAGRNSPCLLYTSGKRYRSHAATIYKWAQEDAAKKSPKKGIPDYLCKEGESL